MLGINSLPQLTYSDYFEAQIVLFKISWNLHLL